MKKSVRFLCLLLVTILLVGEMSCAIAMTSQEKEQRYGDTLVELSSLLNGTSDSAWDKAERLTSIMNELHELGNYEYSAELYYYALVLLQIEEKNYDDWRIEMYFEQLCGNEAFVQYTQSTSSPVADPAVLSNYFYGRKAEYQQDFLRAVTYYKKCLSFYDAMERHTVLMEDVCAEAYQQGEALMAQGEYEAAYEYYSLCYSYKDTQNCIAFIVKELGYDPSVCMDEHQYEDEVLEVSTCVRQGTVKRTCSVCGKTETLTTDIDSNNHTGETEIRNQASATENGQGYTGDTYCTGCGALLAEGKALSGKNAYEYGMADIEKGAYAEAYTLFVSAGSYEDSKLKTYYCLGMLALEEANAVEQNGTKPKKKLAEAKNYFYTLANVQYEGAEKLYKYCLAREAEMSGNTQSAIDRYAELTGLFDSYERYIRLDKGIKLDLMDEVELPPKFETASGKAVRSTQAYYGPGNDYAKVQGVRVNAETDFVVCAEENGFCLIETMAGDELVRVWVQKERIIKDGTVTVSGKKHNETRVISEAELYYGPGEEYRKWSVTIAKNTKVTVFDAEDAYSMIEYTYDNAKYRAWIKTECLK